MKRLGNKIEKILSVDPENYRVTLKFKNGSKGHVSFGEKNIRLIAIPLKPKNKFSSLI